MGEEQKRAFFSLGSECISLPSLKVLFFWGGVGGGVSYNLPLMGQNIFPRSLLKRYIALPQDHGSWVFLLSPLLIGLFAGGNGRAGTAPLIFAALAAFLLRQPVTVAAKIFSGRRSQEELPVALFWAILYSVAGFVMLAWLIGLGWGYLLILALPGLPVFAWHLVLVSRRAERRKIGMEVVGSGVLALAAPAAFWVGRGEPDPLGWGLFGLTWFQSAASIVYAYLRLQQRELKSLPSLAERLQMAARALAYTTFNLVAVAGLSIAGVLPALLPLAYFLQWAESLWGGLKPAIGWKPARIGIRQLLVSTLFTIIFILAWYYGVEGA